MDEGDGEASAIEGGSPKRSRKGSGTGAKWEEANGETRQLSSPPIREKGLKLWKAWARVWIGRNLGFRPGRGKGKKRRGKVWA